MHKMSEGARRDCRHRRESKVETRVDDDDESAAHDDHQDDEKRTESKLDPCSLCLSITTNDGAFYRRGNFRLIFLNSAPGEHLCLPVAATSKH